MSDTGSGPCTLAIDIGGSGLKASVLDSEGRMVVKRVRTPTPSPSPPAAAAVAEDRAAEPGAQGDDDLEALAGDDAEARDLGIVLQPRRPAEMTPHLELSHHPVHKSETYDEHVGDAALQAVGRRKWNRRVLRVIVILRTLLNYDTLHIGGGTAKNIIFKLPRNVVLASNDKGITGGIRLWDDRVWHPR